MLELRQREKLFATSILREADPFGVLAAKVPRRAQ